MPYETIRYTCEDDIALITLNRPDVMNALNTQMRAEILDAVRRACRVIETAGAADGGLPTLARLGCETGLSSHHLQRLLKTLVGISPRQYGEALRVKRLKAGFKQGGAVAPALYDAG